MSRGKLCGLRAIGDRLQHAAECVLCLPEVVLDLKPQPEPGAVAAVLAESHGHFRSDRRLLAQNSVQRLARDAELARGSTDAHVERREDVFAEDGAGVCGCSAHGHILVVLLEVDFVGFVISPLEGDAPRSIDRDRPASRVAFEFVQSEARDIHFLHAAGSIQRIEPANNAFSLVWADSATAAGLEQFSQSLVAPRSDHGAECNTVCYRVPRRAATWVRAESVA